MRVREEILKERRLEAVLGEELNRRVEGSPPQSAETCGLRRTCICQASGVKLNRKPQSASRPQLRFLDFGFSSRQIRWFLVLFRGSKNV